MRRVEGPTLRSYLNEHGRLKPDRALGWLKQLGEVMEEAHSRGIIHCDLKPENIMLEPEGESFRLLVIDFGTSALCLESEVMSKQTRPVGTATYMAPEQLMGSYSAASDLYAFALISLEMLSGVQYRELEIRFDDDWEKDLQIALGKLGLSINTAQVFVRGLRFVPQQRDQSLSKWVLSLEASLHEQ
jgi:serine/threonine protein kinase